MTLRPDAQHLYFLYTVLFVSQEVLVHPCLPSLDFGAETNFHSYFKSLCFFQQGLERRKQMLGCASCVGKQNQFLECVVKMSPVLTHLFIHLTPAVPCGVWAGLPPASVSVSGDRHFVVPQGGLWLPVPADLPALSSVDSVLPPLGTC